jgi:hypothetical protein
MSDKYFLLRPIYPVDEAGGYYDIDDGIDFDGIPGWALGTKFDRLPPDPISISISLNTVEGYVGSPPELSDGDRDCVADNAHAHGSSGRT